MEKISTIHFFKQFSTEIVSLLALDIPQNTPTDMGKLPGNVEIESHDFYMSTNCTTSLHGSGDGV